MDDETVAASDVRWQLDRMVISEEFVTRPRAMKLLRFFVEESLRNGNAAIDQPLIASQALGLADSFRPTRSAYVRVNIARVRKSIDRYYAGSGRHDPVRFTITRGPYRLIATRIDGARNGFAPRVARDTRHRLPMLLLLEPEVHVSEDGHLDHDELERTVAVFLARHLAESTLVTVSGPLRRKGLPGGNRPLAEQFTSLGYDYAANSAIRACGKRWTIRLTVFDPEVGTPIAEATGSIAAPNPRDPMAAADAIAGWLFHKIGDIFVARGRSAEPGGGGGTANGKKNAGKGAHP